MSKIDILNWGYLKIPKSSITNFFCFNIHALISWPKRRFSAQFIMYKIKRDQLSILIECQSYSSFVGREIPLWIFKQLIFVNEKNRPFDLGLCPCPQKLIKNFFSVHANKLDIPHVYCRSKIKEKFTKWIFLVDSPEQISWGNSRLAFVNSWLDRFFSMITDLLWIKRVIRLAVKVPAILKQLFDFVLFDSGVSSSFISYCSLCTRSI